MKYAIIINDEVQYQNIGLVVKVRKVTDIYSAIEGGHPADFIRTDCLKPISEDWYKFLKRRNKKMVKHD